MSLTAEQPAVESPLAVVAEAAAFLRLSRSTVYTMMDDGSLPYIRVGSRRRVRWEDLRRIADAGTGTD